MRIGTRGSALALVQAEFAADRLRAAGHEVEIVTVTTAGDRGDSVSDKSRWVEELERAMLDGRIDVAVHSAKDVPTSLPEPFRLIAVPQRIDPRDALCGAASLDDLGSGARVGTSSLRRTAQLRAIRPDLEVVELRGNVDTRLRKLAAGEADAIVLALAGLIRLGREGEAGCALEQMVPAAGQGTLVVEAPDSSSAEAAAALNDPEVAACLEAERDLMSRLGASCQTPVGAYARRLGEGMEMRAWLGLPDGSEWIAHTVEDDPAAVSELLHRQMSAAGAEELLRRAEAG